jgi:methylmalonyl-CoA mutase N-terminal domain/subunit
MSTGGDYLLKRSSCCESLWISSDLGTMRWEVMDGIDLLRVSHSLSFLTPVGDDCLYALTRACVGPSGSTCTYQNDYYSQCPSRPRLQLPPSPSQSSTISIQSTSSSSSTAVTPISFSRGASATSASAYCVSDPAVLSCRDFEAELLRHGFPSGFCVT